MSEPRYTYVVMYDIRDPARWRLAYRAVRGFATRVQYSVFHFRGSRRTMEQLRHALEVILAEDDDLLIMELCPRCSARVAHRNPGSTWPTDDDGWTIL